MAPAPKNEPELIRVRVARGRTIMVSNRFEITYEERDVRGKKTLVPLRKELPGKHLFKEGEFADLAPVDAERLLSLGFVHLEDEPETRPPSSSFTQSDGPTITHSA